MRQNKLLVRLSVLTLALGSVWAGAGTAAASEFDTGVTGLSLRWDNTVRYNLGVRMEGQDTRLLSSATFDESDAKFKKHDVVTNRLDWLTEIDANYNGDVGARVSAAAWYDHAYRNSTVRSVVPGYISSYYNDTYNHAVDRYVHGPSGEWLDAFVWTNFSIGAVPVNVKVGRHTNVWGEGLLLGQHAISYSQSPVDGVKAVTSPGIETKEVFLPIGQISAKAQVSDNVSIAAQYFYEWESTRAPHGGTYLSGPDTTFDVDRVAAAPGLVLDKVDYLRPRGRGNFGLNARYNMESIESTLGLYYRKFDDYTPWTGSEFNIPARTFRFAYPTDVKLIGASFARVIGAVSTGAEISYRKNAGLHSTPTGISAVDHEGARGNTWHAVLNGVYLMPATKLWDTGSLVAELAYSRLDKVTSHPELFKGVGYACVKSGTAAGIGDKSDGCATRDFAAMAVSFTPQYLNFLPSWNLDLPVTLNYGLHGNAPTGGGGFENALTWSVGAKLTYRQNQELSLRYSDSHASTKYNTAGVAIGGAGLSSTLGSTDRGWLVFTYKTGF